MYKIILLLTVLLVNNSTAQLGRTVEDYKSKFGKVMDDTLPGATGKNWHVWTLLEHSGKLAVLFDGNKSVVEHYFFDSRIRLDSSKNYLQEADKGEWGKTSKSYIWKSPNGKFYGLYDYDQVILAEHKDMFWCFGMKHYNEYQNKIVIPRKKRFSTARSNKDFGLSMKEKDVERIFGKPINRQDRGRDIMAQYKKSGQLIDIYYDDRGYSYRVSLHSSDIFTGAQLKVMTDKLDKKWQYYGAYGLSSSNKHIVRVELKKITFYDAKRLEKLKIFSIPSLKLQ